MDPVSLTDVNLKGQVSYGGGVREAGAPDRRRGGYGGGMCREHRLVLLEQGSGQDARPPAQGGRGSSCCGQGCWLQGHGPAH